VSTARLLFCGTTDADVAGATTFAAVGGDTFLRMLRGTTRGGEGGAGLGDTTGGIFRARGGDDGVAVAPADVSAVLTTMSGWLGFLCLNMVGGAIV